MKELIRETTRRILLEVKERKTNQFNHNILHIDLNEYDSLKELRAAYYEIKDDLNQKSFLADVKSEAEKKLVDLREGGDRDTRVFWYNKYKNEEHYTYVMFETLFD